MTTAFSLLVAVLATLRLTRLSTTDSLGEWLVREPAQRWAYSKGGMEGRRWKLVSGLECPYCIGFWAGVLVLSTLWLAGGPQDPAAWWLYGAGAFALSWVVGHVSAWLD